MPQQEEANITQEQAVALSPRDGIPFPIAPLTKAAALITILLIEVLSIVLIAVSIPIYDRHAGYGRQGAWDRHWNDGGAQATALMWVSFSPF